jgi:hypothetical protein
MSSLKGLKAFIQVVFMNWLTFGLYMVFGGLIAVAVWVMTGG